MTLASASATASMAKTRFEQAWWSLTDARLSTDLERVQDAALVANRAADELAAALSLLFSAASAERCATYDAGTVEPWDRAERRGVG